MFSKKIDFLVGRVTQFQAEITKTTQLVRDTLYQDFFDIEAEIVSKLKEKMQEIKEGIFKNFLKSLEPLTENLDLSLKIFAAEKSKIADFGLEGNQQLVNTLNNNMDNRKVLIDLS